EPTGTAASLGSAGQIGVFRVLLDDASDALKSTCGVDRDSTINVFFSSGTQFDESLLGSSDLESALEGHTVGVVGTIFIVPQGSGGVLGEVTPTPGTSPGPTANPQCILVADQIGTSTGSIPTAVPRRTFRA